MTKGAYHLSVTLDCLTRQVSGFVAWPKASCALTRPIFDVAPTRGHNTGEAFRSRV